MRAPPPNATGIAKSIRAALIAGLPDCRRKSRLLVVPGFTSSWLAVMVPDTETAEHPPSTAPSRLQKMTLTSTMTFEVGQLESICTPKKLLLARMLLRIVMLET